MRQSLAEAWSLLETLGFIAPDSSQNYGWYIVTRRGRGSAQTLLGRRYRRIGGAPPFRGRLSVRSGRGRESTRSLALSEYSIPGDLP